MAATRPQDLTVARADVAAEMVAATIATAVHALDNSTPLGEAGRRLLLRHAHELCELHSLKPAEVLSGGTGGVGSNGYTTTMPEIARDES